MTLDAKIQIKLSPNTVIEVLKIKLLRQQASF